MLELERRQHLLHAELPAFARKLDWTRQIIEEAFEKDVCWYVAFSGGIDSTVLLHILDSMDCWRRSGYMFPVLWGDDGADYPDTLAFLSETAQHYAIGITRIRSMAPWRAWCMEMDRPDLCDDPEACSAWLNPRTWDDTWHSLTRDAPSHGFSGVFLGMLAKESRTRQYALQNGYRPLYQVKGEGGMWHCSPLAAWSKADVWAYATRYGLSFNPVYDRLAELGVPLERRRVAALTCFRTVQFGSVATLKVGWPALFNQLAATFPCVRACT